jgi:pimeloyl-ACP methyl ester carboxylesterase
MIAKAEKEYISINGYDMAFYTAGDPSNPAVLLIHGWASHLGVWEDTVNLLQSHYYCVAMDVIGLGDSQKPSDADYSIEAQASQIVALANALNIGTFGLIGHSRGGMLAMQIAANTAPTRTTFLIDVDGAVTGSVGSYQYWALGSRLLIGRFVPSLYRVTKRAYGRVRRLAELEFSPWFYDISQVPEDRWQQDLEFATRHDAHISNWKTGLSLRTTDLSEDLHKIAVPTLVLFGAQDACISVNEGMIAAGRIPHARLIVIDECGHYPMYEKRDAYLYHIAEFLLD